ncbi:hypothetical protein HDC94_002761 [Leifsonia sp. AK011]|uniref:hypothetical protein n=1 Tax=Leifsonia sp. AK011 TaxID=2723075 RepID=UPI0015CA493E|nr:hypothetical protein [Leifsonia sp. AK011]NYF11605.1 hypothetical protein [Leifsonia sp. AK011]
MKTLLVPGLAVLVLAAATITPAAIHIVDWHAAGATFEQAVARASEVADEAAQSQASAEEARDAATIALADGSGVASAGAGYLAAGALSELVTANTELTEALAIESVDAAAMPGTERPDSIAGLRESTERLRAWAEGESARAGALSEESESLAVLTTTAEQMSQAAAQTVSTESAAALAVSPIASADSKAAFESARDALVAAVGKGALAEPLKNYTAAVEAMFASQRAEEAAAAERAAAEAEADNDSGRSVDRDALRNRLFDLLTEQSGYDPSECVDVGETRYCGGMP